MCIERFPIGRASRANWKFGGGPIIALFASVIL
jgi:hypothetical protein